MLNKLANSDQPETIKAKAGDLKTAVTNLSGRIASLSGEDDKQFKSVAQGVIPIVGDVLATFAQQSIEAGLKKAIQQGADPVNALISAIETDSRVAYERKRSVFSGTRVILVDQYNREFNRHSQADPAKLKAYADELSAGEDRWEAFMTAQPTDGLAAMRRANEALVKFARTPKPNITDFASFVDAIEQFAEAAERVGKEVQSLSK